jgi:hypothetical protein
MYQVVGLNEKDVMMAESFTEALKIFYEHCIEPIAKGEKPKESDNICYIEAIGERATSRMYYPYVFEFAIKAGLIKNGALVEPSNEPSITDLIAEFSRAAILKMTEKMGCH